MFRNIKGKRLNGSEDDDKKDAQFHYGKGPELHGAKGNGSKDDEKNEEEFDDSIVHR